MENTIWLQTHKTISNYFQYMNILSLWQSELSTFWFCNSYWFKQGYRSSCKRKYGHLTHNTESMYGMSHSCMYTTLQKHSPLQMSKHTSTANAGAPVWYTFKKWFGDDQSLVYENRQFQIMQLVLHYAIFLYYHFRSNNELKKILLKCNEDYVWSIALCLHTLLSIYACQAPE